MAALDRVPDPPVVKPHSDKTAAYSLGAAHHSLDQKSEPNPIRFDAACQMRSLDRNWLFQSKPRLPFAPDLIRASDSSPPSRTA
jgi:hypothetical protein